MSDIKKVIEGILYSKGTHKVPEKPEPYIGCLTKF